MERLRSVSSRQNPLLKQLRRCFTHGELTEDGLCAVEGAKGIEEAIRSGLKIHALVMSESFRDRAAKLLPQVSAKTDVLHVPDEVLRGVVATETPQGVAALVKVRQWTLDSILQAPSPLLIVTEALQDPGNLGTLLRSAEAFGATGVLLGDRTVSRYNAKVIRSSAGSVFRVPTAAFDPGGELEKLRAAGVRLVGTTSHGGISLPEADLHDGLALFIGNEGAGLSTSLSREMESLVSIPQSARVESLNAGVAASILLYEAARQRQAS